MGRKEKETKWKVVDVYLDEQMISFTFPCEIISSIAQKSANFI